MNIPITRLWWASSPRLRLECEPTLLTQRCPSRYTDLEQKNKDFRKGNPSFLVEAAGLEPTVSSTRSRKNMFFEHHCLHIVRIFRKITPFCTLFPLFPYRTFPVVVSYVVKPFLLCKRFDSGQLKMENWKLKNFYPPLTNHTRVKKYARNIRLFWVL